MAHSVCSHLMSKSHIATQSLNFKNLPSADKNQAYGDCALQQLDQINETMS